MTCGWQDPETLTVCNAQWRPGNIAGPRLVVTYERGQSEKTADDVNSRIGHNKPPEIIDNGRPSIPEPAAPDAAARPIGDNDGRRADLRDDHGAGPKPEPETKPVEGDDGFGGLTRSL